MLPLVKPADPHLTDARPSSDVVGQRVGDEFVLIHLPTNRIYRLNRTAARLWELLSAGIQADALFQQMLREFDVAEQDLAEELDQFLALLTKDGLLTG